MRLAASQADVRAIDNALFASGAVDAASAQALQLVQDTAWWDLVGKFRQAAARFDAVYRELLEQRDYVVARPALRAQWDALMARVAPIRAQISSITRGADSLITWFQGQGATLDGLGVLPLIPIAVVAAALALIAKWSTDAYALTQRINEQKRLEAAGVDPARAAAIVNQTAGSAGGGFFDSLGKGAAIAAVLGAGGLIAWLYYRRQLHG